MGRAGILDLLGLAATIAIAAPLAIFGINMVVDGQRLGVVFVGLAVLLVAVEQLLTTPSDLTSLLTGAVVGRVVEEPDEE